MTGRAKTGVTTPAMTGQPPHAPAPHLVGGHQLISAIPSRADGAGHDGSLGSASRLWPPSWQEGSDRTWRRRRLRPRSTDGPGWKRSPTGSVITPHRGRPASSPAQRCADPSRQASRPGGGLRPPPWRLATNCPDHPPLRCAGTLPPRRRRRPRRRMLPCRSTPRRCRLIPRASCAT
jgi:hypothetical protein